MRCVDCQGNGAVDAVIAALDWLAGAYVLPAVASLSLGSNSISAALDTALQSVIALGVTGIVAAGNYQSGEVPPSQPSTFICSVQQQVHRWPLCCTAAPCASRLPDSVMTSKGHATMSAAGLQYTPALHACCLPVRHGLPAPLVNVGCDVVCGSVTMCYAALLRRCVPAQPGARAAVHRRRG